MMELIYAGTDPGASRRAFEAMLTMSKIEISRIEEAYVNPERATVGTGRS